jgi:hypothetical protein
VRAVCCESVEHEELCWEARELNWAEVLVIKQPGIVTERCCVNLQDTPALPSYGLRRIPQHYCIRSCKTVMFVFSNYYQLNISSLGSQSKQTVSTRVKICTCVCYIVCYFISHLIFTLWVSC